MPLLLAGAGLLALYFLTRSQQNAAMPGQSALFNIGAGAGSTIVGAATDFAAGAVVGAGQAVGIPPTNPDLCAQYIAANDVWNASFYCPAGTFLSSTPGMLSNKIANFFDSGTAGTNPMPGGATGSF